MVEPVADSLSASDAEQRFTVHVGANPNARAMLGSYLREGAKLRFTPRFRLKPGLEYRAVYRPIRGTDRIERSFTIFKPEIAPSTRVTQIHPSANLLPENLLRFYVEFSAPMRNGEVYQHIHLLTANGDEVELPFIELPEELWDPESRRLTLLLDPGRIKRGLKPRREVGSALRAGASYELRIDRAMRDHRGLPLALGFVKSFHVGPPDYRQPNPGNWRISSPKSGTAEPLLIGFTESLDHALLQRMIWILDASGAEIAGSIRVVDPADQIRFTPAELWQPGTYTMRVDVDLEDHAGNSIRSVFDRDLQSTTIPARLQVESIDVPFSII